MIYFVFRSYRPGTAATNRFMAYLREMDKLNQHIKAVFFSPDEKKSKIYERFNNVTVKYYWEPFYFRNYLLRYIIYYSNVYSFLKELKEDDVVYLYGCMDIAYKVLQFQKARVIEEMTESPEVLIPDTRLHKFSLDEYYKVVNKCDSVVVISRNLQESFVKNGVKEDKIHVINMIIDAERFENIKKDNNVGRNIVYCGSAMNTKDGVADLIKAFAIVSNKYKDVKLYIVGAKPDINSLDSPLRLVNELSIADKVVFTGFISPETMPQILKNATILALARQDNIQAKYGFPTKLGEYLMTANPVVLTSVGNIPDFLTDGYDALIAPPDNPEAFADKLLWALEHQGEAAQIGIRGRDVAIKYFNSKIETTKLFNIIKSLSKKDESN